MRKMAKMSHWQNLYSASKDCYGVQMFKNVANFSDIQLRFIYWLSIYNMLYEELMKHEDDYLTNDVIVNDVRCDAYLVYRNKKHDFLWKKYRREERLAEHKTRHPNKHKSGKTNLIEVDLKREG